MVRIGHLKRALNENMRAQLKSQLTMPEQYFLYVRALQTLGANLDDTHLRHRKNAWQSKPSATTQKAPKQEADVMDWEPTKVSKAILRQNKELKGKRAVWVDQEEIGRRSREGLCFRCARKECRADRCPLKPPRRPDAACPKAKKAQTKAQPTKAKKGKVAVVEVDSGSETESADYETTDEESENE
jgi:hypothetical protein